tara:strand:+ start:93 stop:1241 length:1149 start_codon:yes stop_codon:yes gene_type:complete
MNLKNIFAFLFLFTILVEPVRTNSELAKKPNINYLKKREINEYILGKGDYIRILVKNISVLIDITKVIDANGSIKTQRLNNIYIEGLTISELEDILQEKYSEYINNPNVIIEVLKYRPQKIYVDGEVSEPGLYRLSINANSSKLYKNDENNFKEKSFLGAINKESIQNSFLENSNITFLFPTLTDAIREAGGLTINANLKDIKITRQNSLSNGGGKLRANINLLEGIEFGSPLNNLSLRDGDYIYVGRSDAPALKQLSKALKSALNPKYINIYVGGKVEKPGNKVIPRISSMFDAIYLAGGKKTLIGPIRLIRYNSDGILETKKIKFNSNSKPGNSNNPYLQNGDIVYVGKSSFNIATELISEIISPFSKILEGYVIYKALD